MGQMDKRFDQLEQGMEGIKGEVQELKVQGIRVEITNN